MSAYPDNVVSLPSADDDRARVRAGQYIATYVRHEVSFAFARRKLRIDFRLRGAEHIGFTLPRWYILTADKGRIQCGKHGALVRELSDVLQHRVRHDRLPIQDLKDLWVTVRVREVVKDAGNDPLSELNRYSVIDKIMGRAE